MNPIPNPFIHHPETYSPIITIPESPELPHSDPAGSPPPIHVSIIRIINKPSLRKQELSKCAPHNIPRSSLDGIIKVDTVSVKTIFKEVNRCLKELIDAVVQEISSKDLPPKEIMKSVDSILHWFNIHQKILDQITHLDLSDRDMTYVPTQIEKFRNVQELDLSDNKLTTLPARLSNLIHLQNLNLSLNELTDLPIQFVSLVSLKDLNLEKNKFSSLPLTILTFNNLLNLDISDNQITELPNNIINSLPILEEFDISGNPLTPQTLKIIESFKEKHPDCKIRVKI